MLEPQITWFVRKDSKDDYQEDDNFYAGSYNQDEDLTIDFMIWNNRYGKEVCQDLKDFGITVSFDYEEDSSLLQYCQFLLNGTLWLVPVLEGNQATIQIPKEITLSGAMNDGKMTNSDNYLILKMILTVPQNKKLKMNDIKGMTFNLTDL